jgi:hypothetical protein
MTDILPDCMMPDGGDPCSGFRQIYADHARLDAENLMLRKALEYARRFLRPEDHDVAFVDAALARNHANCAVQQNAVSGEREGDT